MNKILTFLLIFPFIYPLGIDTIPFFKQAIIIWQVLSVLILFLRAHFKIKKSTLKNKTLICVLLFHIAMFIITLFSTGGIDEGFRKIFIYPFSYIVALIYFQKNRNLFLSITVRIIWFEELINLILWNNTSLFNGYFLGIRTYFPIFGILVFYISFLCLHYSIKNTKFFAYTSVIMAIISVALASVSTGIVVYLVLFVLFIMVKNKKFEKVLNFCDNKKLVPIALFINIAIVFLNAISIFSKIISDVLGESLTLTGRTYLWTKAIQEIRLSPFFGYGVYGKYVQLDYWNNALNYMHNELLQILMDGGVLLLFIFILIIISIIKAIDEKVDYKVKKIETGLLFSLLIISITEVPTAYSVFYFIIGIMSQNSLTNNSYQGVLKNEQ